MEINMVQTIYYFHSSHQNPIKISFSKKVVFLMRHNYSRKVQQREQFWVICSNKQMDMYILMRFHFMVIINK